MILLNAGNLWSNEYLDKVIELNEQYEGRVRVQSLFGSIAGLTPTARARDRLPYLEWNAIDKYINKAEDANISIRYTLNQSCIGSIQDFKEDWGKKLMDDVRELHSIGVREWIITSPLLLQLLRELFPDDFLEVSTIAEVATPEDARRWLALGANGVNISTAVNRDFPAIKSIVGTGIIASILANEACLFRCPWRRECYNLSSHDSLRSEELFGFYPFRKCNEVRLANPVEWVMSRMVLPQWMFRYQDLTEVNWFKVAYRTHPYETAIPILEAYMAQGFKTNLCDLWPTIAHLGDTPEPREVTCISCEALDKLNMLAHFERYGYLCKDEQCGVTCNTCEIMYKAAKR